MTRLISWLIVGSVVCLAVPSAVAQTLPPDFTEEIALSGLVAPTAVAFAADGRVFVAEKSGLIKVFADISSTTPTVFADLRTKVHNFWDRGLLGLALHPNFPSTPYIYVLYTHDAPIGGTAPRWGTAGATSDNCPTPPGATSDGCVVSGRLSRLQAAGSVMTGTERVFIEDWCQQFPSHSIGSLAFGPDGALYVSGGDGASFDFADYGQAGSPLNPCGDPPVGSRRQPRPRRQPRAGHFAARVSSDRRTSHGSSTDPSCASIQTPVMPCRTTRWQQAPMRMSEGSSHTDCAIRFASPLARIPPSCGSVTWGGPTRRRSIASSTPQVPPRTSAGRATKVRYANRGTTART